jgi:hypothetical protein
MFIRSNLDRPAPPTAILQSGGYDNAGYLLWIPRLVSHLLGLQSAWWRVDRSMKELRTNHACVFLASCPTVSRDLFS